MKLESAKVNNLFYYKNIPEDFLKDPSRDSNCVSL